jgi:hypothetical protein
MSLIDLLAGFSSVLVVAGLVAGLVVGLGIAYLLHMLYPLRDLASLQALIVGVCCMLGLIAGAMVESRSSTK